ncbi:hypothetical protein COB52_02855 [Candidatus Kaiserbacteria bacterium]|nr:MAG: hypothetical protein COB52_02855 [Candidatus Kaiserbacteria bacterium]
MSFKKNKEDFDCENCGESVVGNGYTNHCPKCLFSKHVDIDPGDRLEGCHGLMSPIQVLAEGDSYILVHKCVKCGFTKRNKMSVTDNIEAAVEIARKIANK